jgi:hypothetical protein
MTFGIRNELEDSGSAFSVDVVLWALPATSSRGTELPGVNVETASTK